MVKTEITRQKDLKSKFHWHKYIHGFQNVYCKEALHLVFHRFPFCKNSLSKWTPLCYEVTIITITMIIIIAIVIIIFMIKFTLQIIQQPRQLYRHNTWSKPQRGEYYSTPHSLQCQQWSVLAKKKTHFS